MEGGGEEPTKASAASTAEKKKPTAINPPPTTMPPSRTVSRKYTNWKHEPAKYLLARAVESKPKGLDPRLAAGDIIIPYGNLQDHVRYAKDKANIRGVSSIIYMKDFTRGETKTLATELDRVYIQQLITLKDLKNNGNSRMEVIGVIQKMTKAYFKKAE